MIDEAAELLAACRDRGLMIATAESCTGGLIAATLTDLRLGGLDASTLADRSVAAPEIVDLLRDESTDYRYKWDLYRLIFARAPITSPAAGTPDGYDGDRKVTGHRTLDGKVVILSACSSASGSVVAGEGVMGLARSFFQASAAGVVGSLWPLRDDEAEAMTTRLARFLADGRPVGTGAGPTF